MSHLGKILKIYSPVGTTVMIVITDPRPLFSFLQLKLHVCHKNRQKSKMADIVGKKSGPESTKKCSLTPAIFKPTRKKTPAFSDVR